MTAIELAVSALSTLLVHATVLLGAVWFAERAGALKHRGWAELAWRAALLGALVSTSVQVARWWPELGAPAHVASSAPANAQADAVVSMSPTTAPGIEADAGGGVDATHPAFRTPVGVDATHPAAGTRVADDAVRAAVTPPRADTTAAAFHRSARTPFALPGPVAFVLAAAWLLALAFAALRFAWHAAMVVRLARRVRRAGAPASDALQAELRDAAAVLDVTPPTLHVVAGIASPMLLPGRRLLLPVWVGSLSASQRLALLAHELAHLQRGDPAWRVLQRVAVLPLAVHPLAWHALSRLDALAEDACDARSARLAGSGRPLAECLAACLAHAGPRHRSDLAVAMADRPGPVVRRVRNLLEESPMSDRPVSPLVRRTALALGIALAVAIPGVAVTTLAAQAFAGDIASVLQLDGDSQFRYAITEDDYELDVRSKGDVAFNAAENDVVRLGAGAKLTVAEERDGVEREIRIFGRDGKIVREYRVDGAVVAFAPEGRAWLATVLPKVIRESGLDADARGQRILARGGTKALLDEIALIGSDYSRGRYLAVLFEKATLGEAELGRAIALAKEIDSDFELRRALQAAAALPGFPPEQMATLLGAATAIDSDFELAELLTTVAEAHRIDGTLLPAWRQALAGIGSDFEHRRVLDALLERGAKTPAVVVLALEAAGGIGSDFERRQVLETAAPFLRDGDAVRAAWFRTAGGLGSDFERRSALEAAIGAGPVDVGFADLVLAAVGGMGSDFEKREVLTSLAARMPDDAGLRERYRARARELGDFERGQAEKALDRFASN